jgi:hypothetical protein
MRDLGQRDFSLATFLASQFQVFQKPIFHESTFTGACFPLRRIAGKKAGWNYVPF